MSAFELYIIPVIGHCDSRSINLRLTSLLPSPRPNALRLSCKKIFTKSCTLEVSASAMHFETALSPFSSSRLGIEARKI